MWVLVCAFNHTYITECSELFSNSVLHKAVLIDQFCKSLVATF